MNQPARDQHFVPQAYLRNFSVDKKKICVHDLLVPHADYPLWRLQSIRGVATHPYLYTSVLLPGAPDGFETWLSENVETPADEALKKVVADQPLDSRDWERLARYAAALDQRTPTSYLAAMRRWSETIPTLIENTHRRVKRKLTRAAQSGQRLAAAPAPAQPGHPLPLKVHVIQPASDEEFGAVKTEVTLGRELWLHGIQRAVEHTARILFKHRWSIIRPAPGREWFTSDHPVLRLNYYKDGTYDFGGGWGNPGSEFILPLSPQHLMYTQVGVHTPRDSVATQEKTFHIQRFLAERAHRSIFAQRELKRISWFRQRHIDSDAYKSETEAWATWDKQQAEGHGRQTEQ